MTRELAGDGVCAIPVGDLFTPYADRYSIPLYQRNYTWGEEQIHRLVHDILDEADRKDPKDYFLGNLVVAPPQDPHEPFDVIDGQQRLTTLYILLTRIRDTVPSLQDQIGPLQPLVYEARDKATRALRGIVSGRPDDNDDNSREDSGIRRAVNIVDQVFNDAVLGRRFLTGEVLDYLLRRVMVVRMPIQRETDLNRYFEVMNTRGAQLSPVDIVKARLMRHLADPRDRALLNHVWSACSDMTHYVAMTATPGDTSWRQSVFGDSWEDLPTANFAALRAQLVNEAPESHQAQKESGLGQSTAITLDDAIENYARSTVIREAGDTDEDRFTSQVTFPTLLLHVLALRRPRDETGQDDRQLDDKVLVRRFADRLEGLHDSERAAWVQRFTTDLLRTRHLFDTYILKRDATLTSVHESTTDDEQGNWSLYRLTRGEYQGQGEVRYSPRYRPAFADDEPAAGPGSIQRRILLLQSALRITYTSPRTMHWITEVLRHVTERSEQGQPITGDGLLAVLESFALRRLDAALHPSPSPDPDAPVTGPDGLPLGFAIPRIVFTYLDYLLVTELNRWDFTFSYRTSVEHFSPRSEDSEHASPAFHVRDRQLLDWLGNLALVTVSANSKFSNYQPAEKANNHAARRQSLKLDLMAQQAKAGSWNDQDIRTHHEKMVQVLRSALAGHQAARTEQSPTTTPTGRHTT